MQDRDYFVVPGKKICMSQPILLIAIHMFRFKKKKKEKSEINAVDHLNLKSGSICVFIGGGSWQGRVG